MILQRHWPQTESLKTLDESYIVDDLSQKMYDFIMSGTYKDYYTNHIVVEIYKNTARLFNKNTDEYIGIGFFKSNSDGGNS